MKKILLLSTASIAVLFIGAIAWLTPDYSTDPKIKDQNAKEFIEEKYGMEVLIVSETEDSFSEGHSYQMAFVGQEDMVFTVTVDTVDYSTIYRDDYEAVQKLHGIRKNMEKLTPKIEELGFTAPSMDDLVEYVLKNSKTGEAVHWLNLETEDSYETIERSEIKKMKGLLDWQRQHGINVQKIHLRSKAEEFSITLDLRKMEDVYSLEAIEAHIVGSDLRLAGKRFQAKWQSTAAQFETERFRFHNERENQWISCHQVNAEGECINLLANVSFAPGELSRQNPHLKKDLNAIFDFFDSVEPQLIAVDLVLIDQGRKGNSVRFFLRERKNYESTEQLIKELVKD